MQEEDRQVEIPEDIQKFLDRGDPKLKEFVCFLVERIRSLEARLRIYENPHVPSSKQIMKEVKIVKEPKPRGAPEGHRGATRETPTPERVVELRPKSCPRRGCGSKRIRIVKEYKKIVEDIKIVKVNTEFRYYECECEDCGARFTTSCEELPKEGNFGPNISSLWATLHYAGTIPFARLAAISENCFDVPVTPKGIEDAIYRTAAAFEPNFEQVWDRVSESEYVRSDETSYPYNGKKHWMWNVSTEEDTLVLMRPTRSSVVLEEVFGELLDGVLNSDCFKGYDRFKAREYQKDWAHVLRDARDLAKHDEDGRELHRKLLRMYRYIQRVKSEGRENSPEVERWIRRTKKQMSELLKKKYMSKAVLNLALRLSKYRDHWFTCLKYRFVEPTNNASERDIRKSVVARKISGAHRSEEGMHAREVMMSTILTSQKRGENPFEFMRGTIEEYNLGDFWKPP